MEDSDKELAGNYGTRWGRPFRDSGGLTTRIPCLAPIWNGDRFVGIALGDLRYDDLLRVIAMPEVDGYLDNYVLDDDGRVIVDRALLASKEPLDNSMLPLRPPSRLALRQAIAEHQTSGTFVAGNALVVFTKMIAPPWYFVAEFDSKTYLLP
ncbi:hypothetical protein EON77_10435 [bacterium]|nr:MAG: hypothetical protein EON77_10435 [bacterium]